MAYLFGVNCLYTAIIGLKVYIQNVLYIAVFNIIPHVVCIYTGLTFFGYGFIFQFAVVSIFSLNRSSLGIGDDYGIISNIKGRIKVYGVISVIVKLCVLRI